MPKPNAFINNPLTTPQNLCAATTAMRSAETSPYYISDFRIKALSHPDCFRITILDDPISIISRSGELGKPETLESAFDRFEGGVLTDHPNPQSRTFTCEVFATDLPQQEILVKKPENTEDHITAFPLDKPLFLIPFDYYSALEAMIYQYFGAKGLPEPDKAHAELPFTQLFSKFSGPDQDRIQLSYVWGPPGTGKTFTAADIAVQAALAGKKILCSATSNIAADRLALSIDDAFSRFGHPGQRLNVFRHGYHQDEALDKPECHHIISPSVESDQLNAELRELRRKSRYLRAELSRKSQVSNTQQIDSDLAQVHIDIRRVCTELKRIKAEAIQNAKIVVATNFSLVRENDIFIERADEMLVLDEASMVPVALVLALVESRRQTGRPCKFLVTGDIHQLAPVVICNRKSSKPNAKIMHWYGQSIFDAAGFDDPYVRQEYELHQRLCVLTAQSRMTPKIADVISKTFYEGWLTNRINVPEFPEHEYLPNFPLIWLKPSPNSQVLAIAKGEKKCPASVESIYNLVKLLRQLRPDSSIIVTTPYRAQSQALRDRLDHLMNNQMLVGTVHKMQGQEADTVIFSVVEPSSPFIDHHGKRLVNVALSRAKRQLFVVTPKAIESNKNLTVFAQSCQILSF